MIVGDAIEHSFFFTIRKDRSRDVTLAGTVLAQMIQAEIGNNAIDPGVKGAFEAEAAQIHVGAQESFLVDVLTILGGAGQMGGQTQNRAVVLLYQLLESVRIPL